jgi:hypothetical protein
MLNLKAKLESGYPSFSYKRLDLGGFNVDFIGLSCTAPPRSTGYDTSSSAVMQRRELKLKSKLETGSLHILVSCQYSDCRHQARFQLGF